MTTDAVTALEYGDASLEAADTVVKPVDMLLQLPNVRLLNLLGELCQAVVLRRDDPCHARRHNLHLLPEHDSPREGTRLAGQRGRLELGRRQAESSCDLFELAVLEL